jgi:Cft2 family RNA processing exonuclease
MRIAAGKLARRTTVRGRPAIVVRSQPYPAGGIHGGHVIVLWNQNGHGYLVSLHYAGGREKYTVRERTSAARAIATSTTTVGQR